MAWFISLSIIEGENVVIVIFVIFDNIIVPIVISIMFAADGIQQYLMKHQNANLVTMYTIWSRNKEWQGNQLIDLFTISPQFSILDIYKTSCSCLLFIPKKDSQVGGTGAWNLKVSKLPSFSCFWSK